MNLVKIQDTKYIQKYAAFLYTNELSERDIKKTIPFTIASKRKCIGINLTKKVKALHIENYKTLMKKIEGDTDKWKDNPCS